MQPPLQARGVGVARASPPCWRSVFRITAIEIARFADPFGDHPPYSFTHLEIVQPGPAGTNVLYGKGLIVKVKAIGASAQGSFSHRVSARDIREQAVTVPMFDKGGVGFDQLLDNIRTETGRVRAHQGPRKRVQTGAHRRGADAAIEKGFRPHRTAGLHRPEGGGKVLTNSKRVQALEGSELRFRLQSNRPVARRHAGNYAPAISRRNALRCRKSADNEVDRLVHRC